MRHIVLLLSTLIIINACDNTTKIEDETFETNILPAPKNVEKGSKQVLLTKASKLYSPHAEVNPLLELFSEEIKKFTGFELLVTQTDNNEADIIFKIDSSLKPEESIISIDKIITVSGGSYFALAQAKSSLLQIIKKEDENLKLPFVTIRDFPDAPYRGLMIDLARKWHDVATIKKLIDLAAFYKINYVQLHFTDYQSYTLPSSKYGKLSSEKHYSFEDLKMLEAYSQLRGVTIIPEIDIPGHSSPFVKKYPEIFAIEDTIANPWIINMGKEEVYDVMDELIGEVLSVFKATPYFHIGGDEAIFNKVMDDPDVKNYVQKHGIGDDVHELYRHFLVRMNDIVKKHNKQMCVWEGFRKEGKIEIPKDIIVFEFETNRYLPQDLIKDGYTVVNTSWKPLYVVNQKKWEPKTIYNWNLWRWENWFHKAPSFTPIQVSKSPLIIGAQMCSWEQKGSVEIPSLRKRIPAYIERIWNTEEKITYDQLIQRMEFLDSRLSLIIDDHRQDSLLYGHNFARK